MPRLGSLAHRLYSGEVSYDFVGQRRRWYALSGVFLVLALIGLFGRGLNLGIEFKGGSEFTVPNTTASVEFARASVEKAGIVDPIVTEVGDDKIRIQDCGAHAHGVDEGDGAAVEGSRCPSVGDRGHARGPELGQRDHQAGAASPRGVPRGRRALPVGVLRMATSDRSAGGAGPRPPHHGRHLCLDRVRGDSRDGHRCAHDPRILALRHRRGLRQGQGEHPRHHLEQQDHLQRGRQPGAQPDPDPLDQHLGRGARSRWRRS